jgi:hypothetical protein
VLAPILFVAGVSLAGLLKNGTLLCEKPSEGYVGCSITIMTTVLIGGCIILLIENQHIEGEIAARYHAVMRPFYAMLTNVVKFISKCFHSIDTVDSDSREFIFNLEKSCKGIRKYAYQIITSGKTIPYLDIDELESLCNEINNVWYVFDRNYALYSRFLNFNTFQINGIRKALIDYDLKYSHRDITIDILPEVAGNFYVEKWQPIDSLPYYYENFTNKCQFTKKILITTLAIELACLVVSFIGISYCELSAFGVMFFTIVSITALVMGLVSFCSIKKTSYILKF